MKLIKTSLLLTAALFIMTGCSKSLDINKTADTILNTVSFDDELIKVEGTTLDNLYVMPATGVEEYVVYVSGSGATANEFGIFKVKDSNAATELTKTLVTRTETLITNFENYVPNELSRINNKLIVQKGDYVLFAVTNDNEDIQDIFNNALK